MIRKVVLRRFKRFDEVEFLFPGHIVLAGPNNTGKTTVLQAIAAWDFALRQWRELGDTAKYKGATWAKAPVARPAFAAVPLRAFDLLWTSRSYSDPIEIEVQSQKGWTVAVELIPDTTEQIYVRPTKTTTMDALRAISSPAVFVPPMTGLVTEEPLYAKREYVDLSLAQARPGQVLRNILNEASQSPSAWAALTDAIARLFNYRILPPDARGAYIIAEYQMEHGGPTFDIASAGSGFQQVLMLLSHLHTRPGSVLLLDEPDAHLHVILQDAIYNELRAVAASNSSQLIVATHSEVVIDSVDPDELYVVLGKPRLLADNAEKKQLIKSLKNLTNTQVMLAQSAPGIFYVEDYTDLDLLRAWAKVLGHHALPLLTTQLLSHRLGGASGASDHYAALKLVRPDLPALELLDRDGNIHLSETEITGSGLQRVRWRRYEIESYLLHPAALDRFIERQVGPGDQSKANRQAWRTRLEGMLAGATEAFLASPLTPPDLVETFLQNRKARTDILAPLLDSAGLQGFPYTRYHEIAAVMTPDEIHPEVKEKLDAIVKAFRQ